ncbi:MAG: UDP-2,3-diacylglucosamine diphosphatase LpxI [Endomicrobia bacterium]|nr:UDP-2,3-diacylglucosamine diphosphatase LpxI [Endomicrobiia bacterium]MCL2506885.1 UDP-2,3-diacylglucosamine diphosphatase LpxI [Endomicrobiia bacterium]
MENIGLIAGNNRFPFLVAEEIKKRGDRVVCIALKEEADPELEKICDKTFWLPLGKAQKIIDSLKSENVKTVIMAGQVKHVRIYSALNLDWRAIKLMGSLVNKKTDTILGAVAGEFEKDGMNLLPSHIYLTHLLAPKGLISGKKLNSDEQKDVDFGFKIAKGIAGFDIGQTVVVKDKSVLAVESIEGTDECIKRAYALGGENSVVVKVAKPNQDFRFDVPVIGVKTIDILKENKVRVMAVETGVTLILDKDEVIKKANESNVTIVGV